MFSHFFNLKESPFGETPDYGYFFESEAHRRLIPHLNQFIDNRKNFFLITGEVGTGKTIFSRYLIEQLQDRENTALIVHPTHTSLELLQAIIREFEIPGSLESTSTETKCLETLSAFLLKEANEGKRNILIIDEAQKISEDALETIRLLTNIETNKAKLLQIILIGQPEILYTLNKHHLRQVKQRIFHHSELQCLNEKEIATYIKHRLFVSGAINFIRFDENTIKAISILTSGNPRLINKICEAAIRYADLNQNRIVTAKDIITCEDPLTRPNLSFTDCLRLRWLQ